MVVQPCCEVRGEVVSLVKANVCGEAMRDERSDVEVETSGWSSAVVSDARRGVRVQRFQLWCHDSGALSGDGGFTVGCHRQPGFHDNGALVGGPLLRLCHRLLTHAVR